MSFTAPVRIIAFSALAALLAACGSSAANENSSANQEAAEAPLLVKTAVAKVEQIPTYFEATGTLASDAESDVAPTIGAASAIPSQQIISRFITVGDNIICRARRGCP